MYSGPHDVPRVPGYGDAGPTIENFTGEVWVETPTAEGKAYFYNARTRETTWTRPVGHVKILSPQEMERLRQKLIHEEEQRLAGTSHNSPELHQPTPSSSGSQRQSGSREPEYEDEDEDDSGGEETRWTEEDQRKLREMESRLALIAKKEREIERKKRKALGRKKPLTELPPEELQAIVQMSRVYVGSVDFGAKVEDVKRLFLPFGPIKDVVMSTNNTFSGLHKGFGFVNYQLPEAAELAIGQMNGATAFGRTIKVGRPNQIESAQKIIEGIRATAEELNRIYVASVHQEFTEEMLVDIFEPFGTVSFCELVTSPASPRKHEGFGFIEYESKESAEEAIKSMNLFDLGGEPLRVGRAILPPDVQPTTVSFGWSSTSPGAAVAAANAQVKKMQAAAETAKQVAAASAKIQAEIFAKSISAKIKASEGASSSSEALRCDPRGGCVSDEMDEECPECPCYTIVAGEALKCGPGGGPRLIRASVKSERQSLDLVKTCPIPGTPFRLKSQVLPVKRRTAEMTVALAPTEDGSINVARGDTLGRCQKISRAWADEVRKFHRRHRAEIVLDDLEDAGLAPGRRVRKRVRLLRPDEKGFEPFDQVVATSYSERVAVCGPGLIAEPGEPFELTLENTGRSVVLLDRKKPIGSARHVNTFGGSLS